MTTTQKRLALINKALRELKATRKTRWQCRIDPDETEGRARERAYAYKLARAQLMSAKAMLAASGDET